MLAQFDNDGAFQGWIEATDGMPEDWTTRPAPEGVDLLVVGWDAANNKFLLLADLAASHERHRQHDHIDREGVVTGPWKPVVYAAKADELRRWGERSASDKRPLGATEGQREFPFLFYDAQAFGDNMEEAAKRFRLGLVPAMKRLAQREAELQKAVADKRTTQL